MTTSPRSRKRTRFFGAAALVLATCLAFILADLSIRWWDKLRPTSLASAAVSPLEVPPIYEDTPVGYRLRRFLDQQIVDPISGRRTLFRTNALGFRGGAVGPKAPGARRVLVLGDSITLAPYLEESETYPAVLESAMRAKGNSVEVLNAGLSGASIREELLLFNETGLLTQPDVVILGMYLNDAARSRMFALPKGLLAHSALARHMMTRRFVNEALEDNRAEFTRLSARPFPSDEFSPDAWRTDRAAFEAQIAGAAIDWGASWFPWAWNEMRPDLEILSSVTKSNGIQLLVILFPARVQIEATFVDDRPQAMWKDLMVDLGIDHLDLLPVLRAEFQRTGQSLTYDQCHLLPSASKLVGVVLAERLTESKH